MSISRNLLSILAIADTVEDSKVTLGGENLQTPVTPVITV
jgi:hypothetical protein